MKRLVTQLNGPQLNWAVATLDGYRNLHFKHYKSSIDGHEAQWLIMSHNNGDIDFSDLDYCNDWSLTGPIIEQERIATWSKFDEPNKQVVWRAQYPDTSSHTTGPSVLIAAMRCYVLSKLGEQIDIPAELM